MVEFLIVLLLVGALALIVVPRLRGRGPRNAQDAAVGELLVTGVSPRPDATGEQFVTISGVIKGPTVAEHVVYQRMVWDTADSWPSIGQLFPVQYSVKNPDNWVMFREQPPVDYPSDPQYGAPEQPYSSPNPPYSPPNPPYSPPKPPSNEPPYQPPRNQGPQEPPPLH
ncbi:hypothetical protein H7I02_15985 [Mycolicibacterium brumae]|uniref:Uncharacterized protein n=1 Tax=Mycolicibacterium brumae TaxID=85968 RepID=A0A2G5P6C9_9MYCO|nr:hypothetical protein [Mycolicibacterium brumae]PIB73902.1 hypothetical protein CQY22_014855 [Mycolicibacterium brumae]RWA20291.1 hypothetical protein MBRU_15595 [Mycolicibacterium brumae DSM 44177]